MPRHENQLQIGEPRLQLRERIENDSLLRGMGAAGQPDRRFRLKRIDQQRSQCGIAQRFNSPVKLERAGNRELIVFDAELPQPLGNRFGLNGKERDMAEEHPFGQTSQSAEAVQAAWAEPSVDDDDGDFSFGCNRQEVGPEFAFGQHDQPGLHRIECSLDGP